MRRRPLVFVLGGALAVASVLGGAAVARASYAITRGTNALEAPTKRRVRTSIDGRALPTVVVRFDLDAPAKVLAAMPSEPPRLVRPTLDNVVEPPRVRLVHADLEGDATFSLSTLAPTTARFIRTEL